MDQAVEPSPAIGDLLEEAFKLTGILDIQGSGDFGTELLRQWLYVRTRLVVEPGDCEVGARCAECLRASVRNRLVVGDADNQRLVPGEDRPDFTHGRLLDCSGCIGT